MGVSVTLDIFPQQIDGADWAAAYDETLELLLEHHSGLMGLAHRIVSGVRVEVFSRSIERVERDSNSSEWCIVGDQRSLKVAETQSMRRDLSTYGSDEPCDSGDVLLASAQADGPETVRVFGNETRGLPYHLPLLAAATVLENRFPKAALVGGDVDREQAEHARSWAEAVLGRSFALPVRTEPRALVMRLEEHLEESASL